VFGVGFLVVGMRTTPEVDNMLIWFVGLVVCFAAEQPATLATVADLGGASPIAGCAGWTCQALNRRWAEG
jgi:hypothetical protein